MTSFHIILSCTHLPLLSSAYPFQAMHSLLVQLISPIIGTCKLRIKQLLNIYQGVHITYFKINFSCQLQILFEYKDSLTYLKFSQKQVLSGRILLIFFF